MLSELPGDPQKRDAILDSAASQPGPEQRKPLPPKMHKVETAAATAAAVIGSIFSKTQNVSLGAVSPIDENRLFAPAPPASKRRKARNGDGSGDGDGDGDEEQAAPTAPAERPVDLVPWVRLREPADPGTTAAPD
jgi:hypothetical protein